MKVGYARISTDKQSLDMQLQALNEGNCDVIYQDVISSVKNRVELNKCLKSLNKGDILVVYKMDRVGRSIREVVNILYDLEQLGVKFISLTDNFDTSTPQGDLLMNMLLSFAQFERKLIIQRVNDGLKAAKDRGVRLGRPELLTPYQTKELKKLRKSGYKISFLMNKYKISRKSLYNYLNM